MPRERGFLAPEAPGDSFAHWVVGSALWSIKRKVTGGVAGWRGGRVRVVDLSEEVQKSNK